MLLAQEGRKEYENDGERNVRYKRDTSQTCR